MDKTVSSPRSLPLSAASHAGAVATADDRVGACGDGVLDAALVADGVLDAALVADGVLDAALVGGAPTPQPVAPVVEAPRRARRGRPPKAGAQPAPAATPSSSTLSGGAPPPAGGSPPVEGPARSLGEPGPAARAARAPKSAAPPAPAAPAWPPPGVAVRWSGKGWNAEVIVSEDGEGWAVELRRDGDEDPVLVSPWTMGRNKKDPKPLNEPDFAALVKAARDFLQRAEAQARAATRKVLQITDAEGAPIKIIFEMVGDEDDPRGRLRALDAAGEALADEEVEPGFPFARPRLEAWARRGFGPL